MRVDMAVELAAGGKRGLVLPNPVMVASGTFGYGVDYAKVFDIQRLGAIVTKTTSLAPRRGNPQVRIAETPAGMLNSIGLQNVGVGALLRDLCPVYETWRVPVIASILGSTVEEYAECAARLEGAPGIAGLELNISSPNAQRGGMEFGQDPETAAAVTRGVVRATTLPVIVKMTPNVADPRVHARAIAEAGADALCVGNTLQAMLVDIEGRRPVIGMTFAGLSGPALKPVNLRQVYQVAQAVEIPVIGCGGISTAADALEYMMAGATAVQVGTATFANPLAPLEVLDGLIAYCESHSIERVTDLVGVANRRPAAAPPP
ncbi:MAG TPA: dihydroorotate dehydrogenase [Dehalococcoidia bacterium]